MAHGTDHAGPPIAALAQARPIAPAPLVDIGIALPSVPAASAPMLAAADGPPPRGPAGKPAAPPAPLEEPARQSLVFAAAPGPALRGGAAYVPQIGDLARSAYIAQLGTEVDQRRLAVRVGGTVVGKIDFQVADGRVAVRIGQVLDLFESRFDRTEFAALRGSRAAERFVSLQRIREAGVALAYDPAYDELVLSGSSG